MSKRLLSLLLLLVLLFPSVGAARSAVQEATEAGPPSLDPAPLSESAPQLAPRPVPRLLIPPVTW